MKRGHVKIPFLCALLMFAGCATGETGSLELTPSTDIAAAEISGVVTVGALSAGGAVEIEIPPSAFGAASAEELDALNAAVDVYADGSKSVYDVPAALRFDEEKNAVAFKTSFLDAGDVLHFVLRTDAGLAGIHAATATQEAAQATPAAEAPFAEPNLSLALDEDGARLFVDAAAFADETGNLADSGLIAESWVSGPLGDFSAGAYYEEAAGGANFPLGSIAAGDTLSLVARRRDGTESDFAIGVPDDAAAGDTLEFLGFIGIKNTPEGWIILAPSAALSSSEDCTDDFVAAAGMMSAENFGALLFEASDGSVRLEGDGLPEMSGVTRGDGTFAGYASSRTATRFTETLVSGASVGTALQVRIRESVSVSDGDPELPAGSCTIDALLAGIAEQ